MPLTQAQCCDALRRLGLAVDEAEGQLTVIAPPYRFDIQIEEDLIEEVARMVGYHRLPDRPPQAPVSARLSPEERRNAFALRRLMAALGYQETINFSFVDERWEFELAGNEQPIRLLNPMSSQMSVMRSSLLGSLLQVLKFNLDRRVDRLRVFELGRIFMRDNASIDSDTSVAQVHQPMRLAGLAYGSADPLQWGRREVVLDFFDLKGDVQTLLAPRRPSFEPAQHPAMHPGRCARVLLAGQAIGILGELHPRWCQSHELPRPPLLFELEKIHGALDVRWGRSGERLTLLNGSNVEVDGNVGVIADDAMVESLAGIMGGESTAVSDATRHIYVEAAFWWPAAVAGRARRYNFSTDAAYRFERGVDPSLTVEHIERISELIMDICGGEAGPIDDQQVNMPQNRSVTLRVARAAKVLGMPLTQAQCCDALRRLGLAVDEAEGQLTVIAPPYRFDIQIEEDLIEEVARMVGYHRLPDRPPQAPVSARLSPEERRNAFALRRLMAALGYQETINFSFVDERWEFELAGNEQPIRLLNPMSSQMSVMRSSLLGSLLQVLKFNLDRRVDRLRVFELGRIFMRDNASIDSDTSVAQVHQPMRLAGLAYGSADPLQWGRREVVLDFFDLKGDVQTLLAPRRPSFEPAQHPAMHPGRCARVLLAGQAIGILGELHPRWCQSHELPRPPLLFELELEPVLHWPLPVAQPVPRRQPVQRDIAVVVREEVSHAALLAAIESAPVAGLLSQAVLFDVYRPERGPLARSAPVTGLSQDEKSLAVRLTLYAPDATLAEGEIDAAVRAVVEHLAATLGARLRA